MKKIILAFDSFKGSVSSVQIAQAATLAIKEELPLCEVLSFPIADGGEGTTDALCSKLDIERVSCRVHNPLMQSIDVSYGITKDGNTAILEMASASGLTLIEENLRSPMVTSTYGTGEVVLDALQRGCKKFIIGIGGSATNDAAVGMLTALGLRFLDKKGEELKPIGSNLIQIAQIDDSELNPLLKDTSFTIACDVNNPLYGENGAAYIYAPQKGATPKEVELLDQGLRNFAEVVKKYNGKNIADIPGAGAAGGMGGGLLAFLNAELKSGIEVILDVLQFEESVKEADLILTGEGRLDEQTTMGKALGGILKVANKHKKPVIAIGGSILDSNQLIDAGFTAVLSIQPYPVSLNEAMDVKFASENITRTIKQIIRIIKSCMVCQQ